MEAWWEEHNAKTVALAAEIANGDWLPVEEVFARALESWRDRDRAFGPLDQHRDLVFDELDQHLDNRRLKAAVVLIPKTGPRQYCFPDREYLRQVGLEMLMSDDGRMPEFRWKANVTCERCGTRWVERMQAPGPAQWRCTQCNHRFTTDHVDYQPLSTPVSYFGGLAWEEIGLPIVEIPGRAFIRRAESDALYPPSKTEAEPSPSPVVRVRGSVWAQQIAEQMKADGAIPGGIDQRPFAKMIAQRMQADLSSGKPLSADYIRSHLKEWGLWPPKLIK